MLLPTFNPPSLCFTNATFPWVLGPNLGPPPRKIDAKDSGMGLFCLSVGMYFTDDGIVTEVLEWRLEWKRVARKEIVEVYNERS